jgi:hypothetical protein
MRFSNDRATTVPSACVADDREIAAGCGDRGILETQLRKILAYFRLPLRIFPQQIHPPRAHGSKNAVETMFFAVSDAGTEFATARRRREIEWLFSLFPLTDTQLR